MWSGEIIYFRPPLPCRKRSRILEPSLFVRALKVFDSHNRPDTGPGLMCGSQNTFGAGSTPICSSLAIDGLHWLRPAANARPECHPLWLSGKLATIINNRNKASVAKLCKSSRLCKSHFKDIHRKCRFGPNLWTPSPQIFPIPCFFYKTAVTTKMASHIYIYI